MDLAAHKHRGRYRVTGEPYVTHCIETAKIVEALLPKARLACLPEVSQRSSLGGGAVRGTGPCPRADGRLDARPGGDVQDSTSLHNREQAAVIAALLHDALDDSEDSPDETLADIRSKFGPVVAGLVEGVSQLSSVNQLLRRRALSGAMMRRGLRGGRRPGDVRDRFPPGGGPCCAARCSFSIPVPLLLPSGRKHRRAASALSPEELEQLRELVLMSGDPLVILVKLADRLHNMRTLYVLKTSRQQAR